VNLWPGLRRLWVYNRRVKWLQIGNGGRAAVASLCMERELRGLMVHYDISRPAVLAGSKLGLDKLQAPCKLVAYRRGSATIRALFVHREELR
jgi:hypothetical protein